MTDTQGMAVILVVDDTPENIDVVKGVLGVNHTIRAAINGQIALKIAMRSPPDLVLLDIQMPGMDGFEVCRQLKSNEGTAKIPVVFLSGETSQEQISHAMSLGAEGYLTKPIDVQGLKKQVEDILVARDDLP